MLCNAPGLLQQSPPPGSGRQIRNGRGEFALHRVYVVGTADTKGEELAYLRDRVVAEGAAAIVVDVGTRPPAIAVDVAAGDVAAHHPSGAGAALGGTDRGRAVTAMAESFVRFIATRDDIAAVVGIGGGGGTSIVTAGMRALPIGLPKLMVSTLASGDVSPYVGVADITMMPSVTDMAGLNSLSRVILGNAAAAIAGMARASRPSAADDKPGVGLTMFGVTTASVTAIVEHLRPRYEPFVFHATGTGGRTLEALVESGMLTGVIDITTTEIADEVVGGVLSAGPTRLDVFARRPIPYVGSVGACDMVNFWARDTVPPQFAHRNLYVHNANVTLMRTTPEECRTIGTIIGRKLSAMAGPVRYLLPERGVSALDITGGAFFDPEADAALFDAIAESGDWTGDRQLLRLPLHINDPDFSRAAAEAFFSIAT